MAAIITLSLDDVGTRYKHYSELLELYELGLGLIQQYGYDRKEKQTELENAVLLLRTQLEVLSQYKDGQWLMNKQIAGIPHDPEEIKGGRGTPLPPKGEVPCTN